MIDNSKEYILCAAVKYILSGKEIVSLGYRHSDGIKNAQKYYNAYILDIRDGLSISNKPFETHIEFKETAVEGFLTSKNRFVDRKEASIIAKECGQVVKGDIGWNTKELRSEDLY